MPVSFFELFEIGIGPSSSHTAGPMIAARRFLLEAELRAPLQQVNELTVELFGSLAITGRRYTTYRAVLFGLLREQPDTIDLERITPQFQQVRRSRRLPLLGGRSIEFDERTHLILHPEMTLPHQTNGLRFSCRNSSGEIVYRRNYYTLGGSVFAEDEIDNPSGTSAELPFPYRSAEELLATAASHRLQLDEIVLANETSRRPLDEVLAGLDRVWDAMCASIDRGLHKESVLPRGHRARRRAPTLYKLSLRTAVAQNSRLLSRSWIGPPHSPLLQARKMRRVAASWPRRPMEPLGLFRPF